MSLSEILRGIVADLVENPDEINIVEEVHGKDVRLTLSVAEGDMGKVIGRRGKIAKAIRSVMKAAANVQNKRVTVDIR